jgi:hypothetical protein
MGGAVAGTGGLAELPPDVVWSTGFSVLVPVDGMVTVPPPPPFVVVDGVSLGEGVDVAGVVVLVVVVVVVVVVAPPEPPLPPQAAVSGASASTAVARATAESRWVIFPSSFLRRKPRGETRAELSGWRHSRMDTRCEANHA